MKILYQWLKVPSSKNLGNNSSEIIFSKLSVHGIKIFQYLIEKNLKPETKKDSKVYVCRAHSFQRKKNWDSLINVWDKQFLYCTFNPTLKQLQFILSFVCKNFGCLDISRIEQWSIHIISIADDASFTSFNKTMLICRKNLHLCWCENKILCF